MSLAAAIREHLCAGLEIALNGCLRQDPDSDATVAAMAGKLIAIELRGLDITCYLLATHSGFHLCTRIDGEPDTILRGTPLALLRSAGSGSGPDMLFSGDLEISGDVETGQQLQTLLQNLNIDWEEQLAQLCGDVPAHQAGVLWRGLTDWGRQARHHLAADVAEYLQEESRHLPHPLEINQFLTAVDTLRGDSERLMLRLQRLEENRRRPAFSTEEQTE